MNNRERQILEIILDQSNLITRETISEIVNVSVSTIRNDLTLIQDYLSQYACEIENVRGVGIKIGGNKEDVERLRNDLLTKADITFERYLQIAYVLITNRHNTVTIDSLCEQFYLSRTAVLSELKKIQSWLEDKKISIEYLKGKGRIQLKGSERNLRDCLSTLIKIQTNILDQNGFLSSYQTIQENIIELLKINPKPIRDGLIELLRSLKMDYSNNALNTLIMHITIGIVRLSQGKDINDDFDIQIDYEDIYNRVSLFCNNLNQTYDVVFTESEKKLIYSYLIYSNDLVKQESLFSSHNYKELANQIINLVEEIRSISISNEEIVNSLVLHIIPLCNRLKNEVILKNPLLEQIKEEYPDSFGIAWMTNSIFKKQFTKTLSEDEIGYLAIHIESMLEQGDSLIETVIVCSQGIGISQLLAQKIKNRFKKLHVVDVISENDLSKFEASNLDLFITTFSINTKKNSIIVSPLLLEDDVNRINSFIDNFSTKSPKLFDEIKLETMLKCDYSNQEILFKEVEAVLQAKNYIEEGFKEDLKHREAKCSTSIGAHTAIPHVSPLFVKKSVICIVTLQKPMLWGSEEIDVLFFLAITKSDFSSINIKLRNLYKLLYCEDFHKQLLNAEKQDQVLKLVDI